MYAALFLFLIFYDAIEARVPMMNYWDELAAMIVFCWGVYTFRKNPRMDKGERSNWICLILLVVIGALSNIVHPGLQDAKTAIIKDVVALCKFPVIFFLLERRDVTEEKQKEIISVSAKLTRWILVGSLVALTIGWFVDLGFYTTDVRILPSCTFVFSNPTFFISSCAMMAAVLIAESIRKNRIFLLLDCLLIFMAQRTKGYMILAFLLLFVILGEDWIARILALIFGSRDQKAKPVRIILAMAILGLLLFVMGKPRIDRFLALGLTTSRVGLHVVGIKILADFFPLGSGFGTFASYLSGKHYSNLYAMYGMDHIWGMTADFYPFISDVFWPYIYGQFGIFGLLLYGKLIISMFFRQFFSSIPDTSRIAVLTVWLYAMIATTSEAYFTNGTGVQMALFLGLIIGYGSRKKAIAEG